MQEVRLLDNCTLNPASFKLANQVQSNTNCPYTITRTYEVKDVSGNVGTAEHLIAVVGEGEPANEPELRLKSAMGTMASDIFTTPGTFSWVCPAGVTSIIVECWGGGGGTRSDNGNARGGGGGGAYARSTFSVTPGITYNITVGAAGGVF